MFQASEIRSEEPSSLPKTSKLTQALNGSMQGDDSKLLRKQPQANQITIKEIIGQAKQNLCYEIEYLQNIFDLNEVRGSKAFELYSHEIVHDQNHSKSFPQPHSNENENNQLLKSIGNFQKGGNGEELKNFIRKTVKVLNFLKSEGLKDQSTDGEAIQCKKLKKSLFQITCHLERIRLYLDDHIYPRDIPLNLVDIDIDGSSMQEARNASKSRQFSERRRTETYKDFFSAYNLCKKIHTKIQKMENKDMESYSKKLNSGTRQSRRSMGILSLDLEAADNKFGKLGFTLKKDSKEIEDLKKQIRNNNVTKKDLFFSVMQNFSPTLANLNDFKEVLNREVCLQIQITNLNIGSNEISMSLYSDNNTPLSENMIIDPCKFYESELNEIVFVNVPLRALIANSLVLIIKVVEKVISKLPSSSQKLFQTDQKDSILKLYKGYSILPLTKMFWSGHLQNGCSNTMEQARFYRPSQSFKIEDKYVQTIEKDGLKKYTDNLLSQTISFNYNYFLSTKFTQASDGKKDIKIVNRTNFEADENLVKDKDFIQRAMQKLEYRFNDLKIDLRQLLMTDQFMKKSPITRIEVALRDNYGTVYDIVYITKCEHEMTFAQTFESQIYSMKSEIEIHEEFTMRIPTKSMDTLKMLYLVFTVQTLTNLRDAKGHKIKAAYTYLDLSSLSFQTELFGVLPLFDFNQMSIIKNDDYTLQMRLMDQAKFAKFQKLDQINGFSQCEDKLKVRITVISNEFTHNKFINKLMLISEVNNTTSNFEQTLNQLKGINPEELINFHDKILDKLFHILTFSKNLGTQDLIFETVIQIIELFQNEYKDYKDMLQNYIQNHYAPQKAYISLLHQLRQTSEIVKQGFKAENDLQNEECLLATMKYLSIILKLIRNSYIEEQQCQAQLEQSNDNMNESGKLQNFRELTSIEGIDNEIAHAHTVQTKQLEKLGRPLMKLDVYMRHGGMKHSMIEEEEDEEEDFFVRNNITNIAVNNSNQQQPQFNQQINSNYFEKAGGANYSDQSNQSSYQSQNAVSYNDPITKRSLMRKKQIRKTIQGEGILSKIKFSKLEFTGTLQRCILSVFEGCHKDSMKSTISLRAILYENIVDVLEQMIDFMDERYFAQLMSFMYEEQNNNLASTLTNSGHNNHLHRASQKPKMLGTSMTNANDFSMMSLRKNSVLSSNLMSYKMGNRQSELIEDYVTNKNFLEGLKDLNFINEEHIIKLKIITMGQILASGILDKINGNNNKIVQAFCDNIDQKYLRKPELSTQVFYFLHQLFAYLFKQQDDPLNSSEQNKQKPAQQTQSSPTAAKNKSSGYIFNNHNSNIKGGHTKQNLNLGPFFANILPEITSYMRLFYKESNAQFRIKESKILEQALSPFLEKTALVCLSVINQTTSEDIRNTLIGDPPRLLLLVSNLKKLVKQITFKEPYHIFFMKKKIQVIRKLNTFLLVEIMKQPSQLQICAKMQDVIGGCKILHIQIWVMIAKLKEDYQQTMRARGQVKDQLGLSKGSMLDIYYEFSLKYQHIGKPWIALSQMKSIINQMSGLIRASSAKTLKLFMELLANTAVLEYQNTQSIQHTCSCLFQVFNDIHLSKDYDEVSNKFNQAFEFHISNTELYKSNQQFNKIASTKLEQMQQLREAMQNVGDSNRYMKSNLLYRTYCQAKLMEVFWELKLFKLFSDNREIFKQLQKQLDDYSEMAFTDLRFLEIIQSSEESQFFIGQREITALIQIDLMKEIVENLQKADLYEKAVQILNQMKDLYEFVLFDYDAVSKVLGEQSKVYKQMSDRQNRHYAQYFKVGFYGESFPPMLKNQEFIYKGTKLAKRLEIFNEIKKYFNDVLMINDSGKPKDEIRNGNQKYVSITSVSPLTFRELKDFGLAEKSKDKEELALAEKVKYLPENLKVYYIENFKNRFYQETVIHSKVGDELQYDIQIEIFKVKEKFPSLFKMQHIYKTPKKIQLNAIDKAIRTVHGLNERLQSQIQNVTNQIYEQGNLNQLGGYIQGTLDSPIQGGIQRFISVFVNEEYLISNQKLKVLELVKKIQEHTEILSDAMQLFQQNSEDDRLVTKFQGDFQKFKEHIDEVRTFVDNFLDDTRDSAVFEDILDQQNTMAS